MSIKNRNDFMKAPFGPKGNVIIVRIFALLYNRAKILTMITLLFGSNGVFIKSFRFLLTFSRTKESDEVKIYFDTLQSLFREVCDQINFLNQ